ncbi:MAG: DUF4159 domain-containing protein [Armatimonadota bacterium]
MIRKISYSAIAAVILTILLAQIAFAGAQTYVDKQHVINAGVLLPRLSTNLKLDVGAKAPYIFYIMGLRDDIKPHGWTFVNPLAGGKDSYYKNYRKYWEVSLAQTTYENLAKFDILYMNADEAVRFPMADRDKLRRYVDGGGCLWVDNGGNMTFPSGTNAVDEFFLPGLNFTSGGGGTPMLLQTLHPLVTTPFKLSSYELASLSSTSKAINPGYDSSFGSIPSPTTLSSILVSTSGSGLSNDPPTIAAIEYGSGRVVFTSGFIGGNIQSPVINWSSVPDYMNVNSTDVNVMAAIPANVRFAYNVVGYATSYTTFRKEYRRTGYSVETLGAPLLKQWNCSKAISRGDIENSPVIWKGIIFYSSGNTLYAMDSKPDNDIDMNGVTDDGVTDAANADCDVIWSYDCPDEISSPTVVTMIDPRADPIEPRDFVLVTCKDGHVYVFDALSSDLSSATLRDELWDGTIGDGDGALLPPVVQNGWIYAIGQDGKIYAHSPVLKEASSKSMFDQSPTWSLALDQDITKPVKVKSGPTLAFVKNQTNGAIVQMLSVIGRPKRSISPLPNDYIYSLPVFVSSDKLTPISPGSLKYNPSSAKFRTSYGLLPISSYPEPEAWAVDAEGNSIPLDKPDISTNPGQVTIRTTSGVLSTGIKVYMSYAIDYSNVTNFTPLSYELPPNMGTILTDQLEAASTPAIGPNDNFYLGVDWGDDTKGSGRSSIYSLWFDGTSRSAKLGFNYFLHGGGNFLDPSAASGTVGDKVSLYDATKNPMTGVPDKLWGVQASLPDPSNPQEKIIYPVANLVVNCTPAVTNDRLFVTASTRDPGAPGLSKGYLLCLKAGQEFSIRLNRSLKDPSVTDRKYEVSVWQPDFLFGDDSSSMSPLNAAKKVPSDMIDYDSGTITINNFSRIRLSVTVGGTLIPTNTLTTSLPVWVFVDRKLIPLDQVDYSSWDNLLWSMAVPDHDGTPCSGVSSSPIVLGDYVYFTCDDGYLFAVPVDATPEDAKSKIVNASNVAEMKQRIDPDNTMTGNYRSSLAGGNGMLVVPSPCGIYLFKNEMSLLTDNHRILEVGTDGNVSWSCDSVTEYTPLSGSGTGTIYGNSSQPLSKPLVAQKYNGSDYLVVDSGNDRILRIDRGGQASWVCTVFDDSYKSLLRSGEPKKLKSPSDAIMWSEFENDGSNWYYVNHCLVADSGNFRLLDIVDRYHANSNRQILSPVETDTNGRPLHQLNWISRTTNKDKRFTYNSVKLIFGTEESESGASLYVNQVWASISNYGLGTGYDPAKTESTGGGQLGGAIVGMKYRESTGNFQWSYDDDSSIVGQLTTLTANNGSRVALSGPTYFDVLDSSIPRLLICDSSAVYVVENSAGNIVWDLTASEYAALSRKISKVNAINGEVSTLDNVVVPIPFMPYRAQILPNNRILIVNSYAGQISDLFRSKFSGEVFEVDCIANFSPDYIEWYTPELWRNDPSADNSDLGPYTQKMKNSSNLEQPTCVQRLF